MEKIRSTLLLKLLTALAEKLLKAMGGIRGLIGSLAYDKINFGHPLAQKISKIADNAIISITIFEDMYYLVTKSQILCLDAINID